MDIVIIEPSCCSKLVLFEISETQYVNLLRISSALFLIWVNEDWGCQALKW